jgi:hypothetical protein
MNDLISRAERFARVCHEGQFRKGKAKEPYVNHLEEVAKLTERWGGGENAIAAAWLHDTVEDCPPISFADLALLFGDKIADIVAELTDDKSLPKAERKRKQLENSSFKSVDASLVKLADKTSNVGAIGKSPPADWSLERRLAYISWANEVVERLPFAPKEGLDEFFKRYDIAELDSYDDLGTVRQGENAALRVIERRAKRLGASDEKIRQMMLSFMADAFECN